MLTALAIAVARRRRWVLAGCAAAVVAALALGRGLFARLGYAVFDDPGAEATQAAAQARAAFGDSDPDIVALWTVPPGGRGFDDSRTRAALGRTLAAVTRDRAVTQVRSPLTVGARGLVSADRRSAFAVVSLSGTPRAKVATLQRLQPKLALPLPAGAVEPQLGGLVPTGRALTQLAERSLARGEQVALPVTAVLLVLIFGSVVAALVPLVLGMAAIALTLGLLALLAHVMSIDAFAINVVTILGLGVAIDYALFLVSRYREELRAGGGRDDEDQREQALARAVATAGRAVLFSGLTVAASLAGLLVFGQPFLRSVAVGGMAVVLLAAALALVVLPALLAAVGSRLDRGRLPLGRRRADHEGPWRRLAASVLRHPALVCAGATLLLLLLGLPFRRLQPSRSDVRALPTDSEPRRVRDQLLRDFPSTSLTPISLLVTTRYEAYDDEELAALYDYTRRIGRFESVERVDSLLSYAGVRSRDRAAAMSPLVDYMAHHPGSARGQALRSILHGHQTLVRVISAAPPDSAAAQRLVTRLRAAKPPPGATVRVFGQAASLHDFAARTAARAPYMLLLVATAMFGVLLVAFRSVVLPLKAMLLTGLSLSASFGALVYVFQDGRLQSLLRYHALGTTDASLPVVMFAVVFGLSMDYEVLILGRIREAWLKSGDTNAAIVDGLGRSGRLVTRAALLMIVVFSAFAAAPVVFVKALGLGMALAVALDASIVRMLLVPSTMALLGRRNWWLPSWPRRRRPRGPPRLVDVSWPTRQHPTGA